MPYTLYLYTLYLPTARLKSDTKRHNRSPNSPEIPIYLAIFIVDELGTLVT